MNDAETLNAFYYNHRGQMLYMGYPCIKTPTDLWVYQELIFSVKPDFIIECGMAYGGSTLFLATMLDVLASLVGEKYQRKVIGIDSNDLAIRNPENHINKHTRILPIINNSTSLQTFNLVQEIIKLYYPSTEQPKIMVILDSNHHSEHVSKELELYSILVSVGSYIIVEDTCVTNLQLKGYMEDGGPLKAVNDFLSKHPEFKANRNCEKFIITFNPNGYLQRMS